MECDRRPLILRNADVRVMDPRDTRADTLAWQDGRILAVGRDVPGAEEIDARGATVLPGFVDAHQHPWIAALYGASMRLVPPTVTDIPSLQAALVAASRKLAPGRWLVALDWDERLLAEKRAPRREEIDEAVPDHPVFAMHFSCHRAIVNRRALEAAGIESDGLLIERAMSRAESLARADRLRFDREGFAARLADHHAAMVAVGITRVADATVPGDMIAAYREAARLLVVPTILFPVSTAGYLEPPGDALDGPVTGETDGILTIGPMKLVFDGGTDCAMCLSVWQSIGSGLRACAMAVRQRSLDPIRTMTGMKPRVGLRVRTGIRFYRPDEARAVVRSAIDRGFGLAIHATGNEAVAMAVDAYEASRPAGIPRIEHAAFLDRELVSRIAGIGAAAVVQPRFLAEPMFESAPSIPGLRLFPIRWLLDAGVRVAGSSDFPCAAMDPLEGIRSAMDRRTRRGHVYEEDQRIGEHEAIAMYTRTAAEVCGCLDTCGTLEAGKRAEFVVLDGPIDRARVRTTVIGGRAVFGGLAPEVNAPPAGHSVKAVPR